MDKTLGSSLENTLFWKGLVTFIRILMIICSVVTAVVIFIGAFMRYVLHKDFYGIDDIILLFAFWLYFVGAVHGSYENSHIKADILMTMMRNVRVKNAINLVGQVILIIVNVILIIWAWEFFMRGVVEMPKTTALHIPYFVPRFAIFFGLLLMEFYHIYYFIINTRLFVKVGYFFEPGEFDYFSDRTKKKYPNSPVMSKEEANAKKKSGDDVKET